MAREAARLLEGSGWLPEVLRLPVDETPAGVASAPVADADGIIDDDAMESAGVELPAFLTEGADAEKASVDRAEGDGAHLGAAE